MSIDEDGMTEEEMWARVAEINEKIAGARQWGALLTALNEERNGLMRALREYPSKSVPTP